jgi:hypothetical protein
VPPKKPKPKQNPRFFLSLVVTDWPPTAIRVTSFLVPHLVKDCTSVPNHQKALPLNLIGVNLGHMSNPEPTAIPRGRLCLCQFRCPLWELERVFLFFKFAASMQGRRKEDPY